MPKPYQRDIRQCRSSHGYSVTTPSSSTAEGLNIVEPIEAEQNDGRRGVVVNLASWADETKASLEPHEPEPTEVVVDLKADTHH